MLSVALKLDTFSQESLLRNVMKVCGVEKKNSSSALTIPVSLIKSKNIEPIYQHVAAFIINSCKPMIKKTKIIMESKIIESIANFQSLLHKQKECGEDSSSTEQIIDNLRQSLDNMKAHSKIIISSDSEGDAWKATKLKEAFIIYAKEKSGKQKATFEVESNDFISINEFTKFLKEYKISLSALKVKELYKKNALQGKAMHWEQFLTALPAVGLEAHKERIEILKKKISMDSPIKPKMSTSIITLTTEDAQTEIQKLEALSENEIISNFWKNLEQKCSSIEIVVSSPKKKIGLLSFTPVERTVSIKDFKTEMERIRTKREEEKSKKKKDEETRYKKSTEVIKDIYEKQKQERSSDRTSIKPIKHRDFKKTQNQEEYIEKMTLKDLGYQYKQSDFISPIDEEDDIEVLKKFKIVNE